jgi:serine/threonine-protein kinase
MDDAVIEVLSVKTGQTKIVQRGGYFGRYLPTGHLVYLHNGTLFAVPFDGKRLETRGAPTPLLEDAGTGGFDFSNTGIFIYSKDKAAAGDYPLDWMDRSGKLEPILPAKSANADPHLSPDGKLLAFAAGAGGRVDVSIYDLARQTTAKLTFTGDARQPVWAPDGKHIVFDTFGASRVLWWVRADGAGEPVKLLEGQGTLIPYSISPDGRRVAYTVNGEIWTLPLDTSDPDHPHPGKSELFLGPPASESSPAFSPDGRWIAYESNESGARTELFVRPFRAGGNPAGKWMASAGEGVLSHVWSRDGRELLYATSAGRIMSVAYTAKGDVFVPDKPRPWPGPRMAPVAMASSFDVTPDGKRLVLFMASESDDESKTQHISVMLNFFDEVRRRLP